MKEIDTEAMGDGINSYSLTTELTIDFFLRIEKIFQREKIFEA